MIINVLRNSDLTGVASNYQFLGNNYSKHKKVFNTCIYRETAQSSVI